MTTTKIVKTAIEVYRIEKELLNAGFQKISRNEYRNNKIDVTVIIKLI